MYEGFITYRKCRSGIYVLLVLEMPNAKEFLLKSLSTVGNITVIFTYVCQNFSFSGMCVFVFITLCASKAAAQCIVIGPVCRFVACLWVCYHDNSKLHASILTKLGL